MKKTTGPYPAVAVDGAGSSVVPHAGSTVLLRTAKAVGLTSALAEALTPWRKPLARHDPGKIVLDVAVSLTTGGDCLADLAQLRAAPEVFGQVASDPTVSRCIDALAADAAACPGGDQQRPCGCPGEGVVVGRRDRPGPRRGCLLAAGHRRGRNPGRRPLGEGSGGADVQARFGFHPLWAFCDHGAEGTGEPLAFELRPGNAGSNTVVDHIAVLRAVLAQLPGGHTRGKKVLVRVDGAGGAHEQLRG